MVKNVIKIEKKDGVPMCTLEQYEIDYADRHLVHGVIEKWAKEKPDEIAMFHVESEKQYTWQQFNTKISSLALKLVEIGIDRGDYVATMAPYLAEHIFLEYACFKIGAIHVPLDMRLKPAEVTRCLTLVKAKVFCHLGVVTTGKKEIDFIALAHIVKDSCPFVEQFIQFSEPDQCRLNTKCASVLAKEAEILAKMVSAGERPELERKFAELCGLVKETDGCQVIYTTGSTGFPKPALLSHRGITAQNLAQGKGLAVTEESRLLVNLPPSHVGGQAEQLMTPLFMGAKVVVLNAFNAELSLEAVQKFKVTHILQIPALFNYERMLPNYDSYDLSSLKLAVYGGQSVSRQFLENLQKMCSKFSTGDGLTEMCGFCTYTPLDGTVDDILAGVGYAMPISPISIRETMNPDGTAGAEKPKGEIGEICFSGPQLLLEYVNDPENTAKTITKEGILYTGDLGSYDEKGLHFAGRSKLLIKPKGFNVFPTEVENFLSDKLTKKVSNVAVVGTHHEIISEAIVAFVVNKPGVDLAVEEVNEAAKDMASYKRPSHVVILDTMPLNRVSKTDYVELKRRATEEAEKLRNAGGWDSAILK